MIKDVPIQGIGKALQETQPKEINNDAWKTIQNSVSVMIMFMLALAPTIKYDVLDWFVTVIVYKIIFPTFHIFL